MLPHFYTKLQQPLSTLMAPNTPRLRTLLVTVGSTLFPALTAAILSPLTLDHLSSLGVTRLIVQYGREDLSASLSYSDLPPVLFDAKGGARMAWKGMEVELMRFTDDFEGLVRAIGAVISHAGSGSILTVLRAPRPLLVVPNTSLMDNHQAELADALGSEGYLTVVRVEDLQERITGWLSGVARGRTKAFPGLETERFRRVLDETAGFAP